MEGVRSRVLSFVAGGEPRGGDSNALGAVADLAFRSKRELVGEAVSLPPLLLSAGVMPGYGGELDIVVDNVGTERAKRVFGFQKARV